MSRVVGRVVNVSSVHGVLAIPELGRVYASATGANEVVAIDMATLGITARMPQAHIQMGWPMRLTRTSSMSQMKPRGL